MEYPQWNEDASDEELIKEFYGILIDRYPHSEIPEEIEENGELIHVVMGAVQRFAEDLCTKRKIEEAKDCFELLNAYFCRSRKELLNAFNVSFLEYFEFHHGLTEKEFKEIMPETLFRGYTEITACMENLARQANVNPHKPKI